jgi:hypothetical protein
VCGRFNLKTAVDTRLERPTVSNHKGLQTLRISPFWSDAEQRKMPSSQPLAALQHFQLPFLGSMGLYRLRKNPALRQGTTSVVPQTLENKGWALAPEGMLDRKMDIFRGSLAAGTSTPGFLHRACSAYAMTADVCRKLSGIG